MTRSLTTLSAPIPEASDPADTDTWGGTTETFHEAVDRAVGGDHDISTTGGNTTLSEAQNDVLQLYVTGTLVSNAVIYVKARPKVWIVRNATSGSFSLTVRVVGDVGAAVTVTQGRTAIVHCDGTACYIIDLGTLAGTPASVSGPVEYPDGTAGAPSITNTGDTNTGIYFPAEGTVGVATQGVERIRFDDSGNVMIARDGAALLFGDSVTPRLQVHGTGVNASIAAARWSNDALPAHIRLGKSRGAAVATHTVVAANDPVGAISFDASDGTNFEVVAQIVAEVAATPGNNDTPGRLIVYTTPDGSNVPAESLRIDENAFLTLDGDIDTGMRNGGTNILHLATAGANRLTLDANGVVFIGGTAAFTYAGSYTPISQVNGGATAGLGLGRFSADSSGPKLSLFKSRNATAGSLTVVQSGDELGSISFEGNDGTNKFAAALISAAVDAAPGTADMPGRLSFWTVADGGTTMTERMRIDSAGRMGIGGVPQYQSWFGATNLVPSFQLHGTTQATAHAMVTSWSSTAANGPALTFGRAKSGTVGTIGAVSLGDTLGIISFGGDDGFNLGFRSAAQITSEVDATPGTGDMPGRLTFWTAADGGVTLTERMRINSAGTVIIGGQNPVVVNSITPRLEIIGTDSTTTSAALMRFSADGAGTVIYGAKSRNATPGSQTAVTAGDDILLLSAWGSDGTNFVEAARITMEIDTGVTIGSNDMPGRLTFSTTADGASSPTARMTIDSGGEVNIPSGGTLRLATTTDVSLSSTGHAFQIGDSSSINLAMDGNEVMCRNNGAATTLALNADGGAVTFGASITIATGLTMTDGQASLTRAAAAAVNVNRQTDDGILINFQKDGATQGNINVSAGTVSISAFTASHWTEMREPADVTQLLLGTIVESVDELMEWPPEPVMVRFIAREDGVTPDGAPYRKGDPVEYQDGWVTPVEDRLPKCIISRTPASQAVYGVYNYTDEEGTILVNALGAFWVRIAQGQTPRIGDLIESNGDGTGRVQPDDILRSKTVAKITSTTVKQVYADGSFVLPCTLHCG